MLYAKDARALPGGVQFGNIRGPLYSLPRLCLEGSYSISLKGPGSVPRPGRFPRPPPRGSPSCAPLP
eukprot:6957702-Pyramimonas_sp.AAC.1